MRGRRSQFILTLARLPETLKRLVRLLLSARPQGRVEASHQGAGAGLRLAQPQPLRLTEWPTALALEGARAFTEGAGAALADYERGPFSAREGGAAAMRDRLFFDHHR